MKNIGLTLILCFITFLIGIIIGHKEAKKETYPNYDLTELNAKLDSLAAKKDTVINQHQTIINNEITNIKNTFNRIDSLSSDSLYSLWTSESRFYKPLFN
ncbi:MAG: hypothetical protein RLZZ605_215 [Bacteroidota bacterium]|jgi:hypothetical protein